MHPLFERLQGGLIVSCQALPDEPMHGSQIMAAFARAAEQSGARGIRANGPDDIRAIKAAVRLPVIGLHKLVTEGCDVYITPTLEAARGVKAAGADVVALDATGRARPDGTDATALIRMVRAELGVPVLADVSTLEEGRAAEAAGADAVATTMAGYTPYSRQQDEPDFQLLDELVAHLSVPVILEGRVWEPAQVRRAFQQGAWAVVVGGAITRPQQITRRFVQATATVQTEAAAATVSPLILVVDDDMASVKMLRKLLQYSGYQVEAAYDGHAALAFVARQRPDLILLDLLMPGLNGYEVLSHLLANPQNHSIPVLFMSASNEPADEDHALSLGAKAFLNKPLEMDLMLQHIQRILGTRPARGART